MNKGFTLIEIMVSMSIFVIVMLAAVGALFVTTNSVKQAKAIRVSTDNLNYAMEKISRNIRLGSQYYCFNDTVVLPHIGTADCLNGLSGIAFASAKSSNINTAYVLSTNTTGNKSLQSCHSTGGCINLTSPEVDVTDLKFFVRGSSLNDLMQPSVFIRMKGTITVKEQKTEFFLQTLASQRSTE